MALAELGSAAKHVHEFFDQRKSLEQILAELIAEKFSEHLPRLAHLCPDGPPSLDTLALEKRLNQLRYDLHKSDDLIEAILPLLPETVATPGATCSDALFQPIYLSISQAAARGLWNKIGRFSAKSAQVQLSQNETLIKEHLEVAVNITALHSKVDEALDKLAKFATQVHTQVFDELLDSAPPSKHTIDRKTYANPFVLARSEDFNHNYEKLAKLFQDSPDWASIQRRTDNVFIEGGRGTGKSMLLRRLTAQASIAAARLASPHLTFAQLDQDYFGIYVKLTRGYYEQFGTAEAVAPALASLLAQHELNIEILDAFVDTLVWLDRAMALSRPADNWADLSKELSSLLPNAPQSTTLEGVLRNTLRFEQDQVIQYYRDRAFERDGNYTGSATQTVNFLRRLSELFRRQLFPSQQVRLFLLLDEFETLLETQQTAINTVMKMRLPDLSTKVAVRRHGRKTSNTFTVGDPIQDPRDYTPIFIDYDIQNAGYRDLLAGIASRRLDEAGYSEKDIRKYLTPILEEDEVSNTDLDKELEKIWESGNRRNDRPNAEFRTKYTSAAIYRVLNRTGKRKTYAGFDQYVTLSSGVVSNFIEVCKYAFYFALNDGLPLRERSDIPLHLQTEAAYRVSQRLLGTVEGNVPQVGATVSMLLSDLGAILRARLLSNASEPEANRLAISDFNAAESNATDQVKEVLNSAITWSVFHAEIVGKAFRPKNSRNPPTIELIINRIYCPALEISPRSRWRIQLSLTDIGALINPTTRQRVFRKLVQGTDNGAADQPGLPLE